MPASPTRPATSISVHSASPMYCTSCPSPEVAATIASFRSSSPVATDPPLDAACTPAAERHDLEVAIPAIAGDRDGAVGLLGRLQIGRADLGLGEGDPAAQCAVVDQVAEQRPRTREPAVGHLGTPEEVPVLPGEPDRDAGGLGVPSLTTQKGEGAAAQLEGTARIVEPPQGPAEAVERIRRFGSRPRPSGTRRALTAQSPLAMADRPASSCACALILPMMAPNRPARFRTPRPIRKA